MYTAYTYKNPHISVFLSLCQILKNESISVGALKEAVLLLFSPSHRYKLFNTANKENKMEFIAPNSITGRVLEEDDLRNYYISASPLD